MRMEDMTWKCHVCGERRPDAAISVHTVDQSAKHDLPAGTITVNVRHCNDREACVTGAPTCPLVTATDGE